MSTLESNQVLRPTLRTAESPHRVAVEPDVAANLLLAYARKQAAERQCRWADERSRVDESVNRQTLTIVRLLVVIALTLCACSKRSEAEAVVNALGPERLVSSARQMAASGPRDSVPPDHWPEPIRQLRPEHVRVVGDGVYVRLQSRLATEAGVYIPAAGVVPKGDSGTDPSLQPLGNGLYWYEIKG